MSDETNPEVVAPQEAPVEVPAETPAVETPQEEKKLSDSDQRQMEIVMSSFTFVDISQEQKDRQKVIFDSARELAKVILLNTGTNQLQMESIQTLYKAVTLANQSVAFGK